MDNQQQNDLWQGGPWEQPAPVFPAPPAVHVPKAGPPARPALRLKKRRRRRWPWFLGLLALIIGVCAVTAVLEQQLLPTLSAQDYFRRDWPEEDWEEEYSTDPPAIPQAATGTGVTLTLLPPLEQAVALPDIYDQVLPSCVSVQADGTAYASAGSGIILTEDGYILTNAHVVAGTRRVSVQLHNNQSYPASLVGFDAKEDLAVLKIEAQGLTPVQFGDSNALRCGDSVAALGDSLGYESTFTNGIVSALDREMTLEDGVTMILIQTNAAINFGNSGGPLINQYGQVVGIKTLKIVTDDGSAESLGFAIPSTRVKYVVDRLIAGQPVYTAMFGFTVSTILEDGGLKLLTVSAQSDAYAQGLQKGDIITAVNGQAIDGVQTLLRVRMVSDPGDTVELTYLRDGVSHTAQVALIDSSAAVDRPVGGRGRAASPDFCCPRPPAVLY